MKEDDSAITPPRKVSLTSMFNLKTKAAHVLEISSAAFLFALVLNPGAAYAATTIPIKSNLLRAVAEGASLNLIRVFPELSGGAPSGNVFLGFQRRYRWCYKNASPSPIWNQSAQT